jgi:hypothetical protein
VRRTAWVLAMTVGIFLLGLVAKAPAYLVANAMPLPDSVVKSVASGTVWDGGLALRARGLDEPVQLAWSVNPLGLLAGCVEASWTADDEASLSGAGIARWCPLSGVWSLRDSQVAFSADVLPAIPALALREWRGDVSVTVKYLEQTGSEVVGEGQLRWQQGVIVAGQVLKLGQVDIAWSPNARGMNVGWKNAGAAMATSGDLALGRGHSFALRGQVVPNSDEAWSRFLGAWLSPTESGVYPLQLDGNWADLALLSGF